MKKKKVVAIIQARMGSTRLLGKVVLPIVGKPILWHVIERAKRCKKVDNIVVATTTNPEDKVIIGLANRCGIQVFAGKEDDVLDRYYQAAKEFSADIVVRITADCPLINPITIDRMVNLCLKENADYICGHPDYPSIEQGMEIISFPALEKIKNLADEGYQRGHVTIFIKENPGLFKIATIIPKEEFQREDMRLTVDTKDDLKLMRGIYNRLYKGNGIIGVGDVVRLLEDNPGLKGINSKVAMSNMNKYVFSKILRRKLLKSLNKEEGLSKIIFRCDASPDIGLGHLVRCLAVAKGLEKQNQIIFATIKDGMDPYIRGAGFVVFSKEKNETEGKYLKRLNYIIQPNIIVIDKRYPYSTKLLNNLKQANTKIIMIDNICEGLAVCDEIIFPNAHFDKSVLKKYLSERQIKEVKTGLGYVILRNEVLALKNKINHNPHNPPNVIITTGGTDPEGVLLKLIPWLKGMDLEANFLILISQAFKYKDKLEELIVNLPDNFQVIPYSLKGFLKADIVICTFGVTIYEMIYLQLPTICIPHSSENARSAKILKGRYGVIEDLGFAEDVNPQALYLVIKKLLEDKAYYKNITKKCNNLIDGRGAKRIGGLIAGDKYV